MIREFSVDAATVEPGREVTLRWEALNAYSLTIEPEVGDVATRGARRVAPAVTTTYTLTATGRKRLRDDQDAWARLSAAIGSALAATPDQV